MGKEYPSIIPYRQMADIEEQWKQAGSIRRRKCRLTPEEIFTRLQDPTIRRCQVAEEAGITPQRLTQIIGRYLKGVVEGGHKSRTRNKKIKEQAWLQTLRGTLPDNERVRRVIEIAKEKNLRVESILRRSRGKVLGIYADRVSFNEIPTFICNLSNKQRVPKGKQEFSHTSLSPRLRRKIKIVIFHLVVDGYPEMCFVVPAKKVLRLMYIAIPLQRHRVHNNRPHRINFWRYLEQWSLFARD